MTDEALNAHLKRREQHQEEIVETNKEYLDYLEEELEKLQYITLPDGTVSNCFEAYIVWKRKAAQLEAKNDRLLGQLVAGEELYISRGMEIARLEVRIKALEANVSKSVLRRIDAQLGVDDE